MIVLPLFLVISLKFHLTESDEFLNIPLVVILNLLCFTFGISNLKASLAGSFNTFLQDKYVTKLIITTTANANIYTAGTNAVLYTGTSKNSISCSKKNLPSTKFPTNTPIILAKILIYIP